MKKNTITLNKNDLTIFLEYLLGHVENCYYNECKKSIDNFIKRNTFEKTSLQLLEEVVELGFEKEYVLKGIDFALDEELGFHHRKSLDAEYINNELYETILNSFKVEKEEKEGGK